MAETINTSALAKKNAERSRASKAAILKATREELAENGWRSLSVDNIARRAKASKQTIYRGWASIGAMCVDAGLALIPDSPGGAVDPVEKIMALVLPIEAAARTGAGHTVLRGTLIAASDDSEAGKTWRAWVNNDIRQPLRSILVELANKRVVSRDYDIDDAVEILIGPIVHRLLIRRAPVPEGLSRKLASDLISAYAFT